jgi:AcrR family transcriptional regulator
MPPEARRAAIIEAVRPLLIESGERITSREIADAAGIAEGTIFRVFADKNELIEAAVEAALDPEPFERAVRAIDTTLPLRERLIAVVELSQRRSKDIWRLVSSLPPALAVPRPLSVSAAIRELFESVKQDLRVDPDAAAGMLRALTLAMTHPMLAAEPADPDDIVDVVLHGIAGTEATS